MTIPRRFRQLGRRPERRGVDDMFWVAFGTFDHALSYYPEVPLQGYAQVLNLIPSSQGRPPLVIGSPLFVQMAER